MDNLVQLISTHSTVFSFQELKQILKIPSDAGLKSFLQRAKEKKALSNPFKGFRALPNYDPRELACKIRPQAYISCETVLFKEGVFFQFYGNTVSCISTRSEQYILDEKYLIYYKIKPEILHNSVGIRTYERYRVATPERALCDYMYLNPRGVIDAPESINPIRLQQILPFYPKKTVLHIQKLLNAKY
ncbi:MAG: hypothetical protein LBG59_04310 [Candidatus Peribacteria bacterium]|jgi:hypothetical protein|nr:hypothetical protein [Candidatus Peribacteria bacterium]